jgi:hypothetical protein
MRPFSNWQCKNPRDKVYRLLGLLDCGVALHTDYKKAMKDVFFDSLRALYDECHDHKPAMAQCGRILWSMINMSRQLQRNLLLMIAFIMYYEYI